MRRVSILLLAASLSVADSASAQTVINFDNLSNLDVVTNQYAGVVFSSSAGNVNYVTTQNAFNASKPNFICAGAVNSGINCTSPTFVTFLSEVSGVSLNALGIDNTGNGKVAQVDLYNGVTFLGSQDIFGNGERLDPVFVNLASWGSITRFELKNITDDAGIGWDDITYTAGVTSTVPEPASVVLMMAGLAGLVAIRRRRA